VKELTDSIREDVVRLRLHRVTHAKVIKLLEAMPYGQKARLILMAIEQSFRIGANGDVEFVQCGEAMAVTQTAPMAMPVAPVAPVVPDSTVAELPASAVAPTDVPAAPRRVKVKMEAL